MKKIITVFLLSGFLFSPFTSYAQANLSPTERQTIVAQIEELKQILLQLIAVYNATQEAAITKSDPYIITETEHVLGRTDAEVVIISYIGLDEPFSKIFYERMRAIVDDYDSDEFAWIARHFPLPQLHPNGMHLAAAAECVAQAEGGKAFWDFTEAVFNGREIGELTDISDLETYANSVGVSDREFSTCLENKETTPQVEADIASGNELKIKGTPTSYIIVAGKEPAVINGAQPEKVIRQIIDNLLVTKEPARKANEANPIAIVTTNVGTIELELFANQMPITVRNFINLSDNDFYDGTKFHRVINGFMIQGGDPNSKGSDTATYGTGGPGYTIEDEFVEGELLTNVPGTIAMARSSQKNSGGSQFFINVAQNTFLDFDNQPASSAHPVFGRVIKGIEVVMRISSVNTGDRGIPLEPIIIESITIRH